MRCRHYRDVAGDLIFGNQSEAEARHIYRLMNIGSKAIAMRMERARFVVAGCAAVFGWCVAIEHAPAQPLITACPSAAADFQSVEPKHHTANKRNSCFTQCAKRPSGVRSALWFLFLWRFPPRAVFSRVPAANRPGSAAYHRLNR